MLLANTACEEDVAATVGQHKSRVNKQSTEFAASSEGQQATNRFHDGHGECSRKHTLGSEGLRDALERTPKLLYNTLFTSHNVSPLKSRAFINV